MVIPRTTPSSTAELPCLARHPARRLHRAFSHPRRHPQPTVEHHRSRRSYTAAAPGHEAAEPTPRGSHAEQQADLHYPDEGSLPNPEGTGGAPYAIWSIPYTGKTRQVTQDLRLTSTGNTALQYIVGAYYQHEVIFNSTENIIFTDPAFNTFNDYRDCAANSFGPGTGYSIGANINLGCDYYNSFDQIRNSWAVYTDDSYKASDWVTIRAGLRYNHDNGTQKNALNQIRGSDQVPIANLGFFTEQPDGSSAPTLVLPGSPNYDALINQTRRQDLHNTAVTGRAGVDFNLTSDSLLYLNYSKGYRSAAFNAQFLFTPSDLTTVLPESLDSMKRASRRRGSITACR
jgi:iron complex outermembrane receptor protein